MVKALLYIFAVLGLLISPVYAQATQKGCAGVGSPMMASRSSHTAMPEMKSSDGMACCGHDKADSSSHDKTCFNDCIAMCGISVGAASDETMILPVLSVEQVSFNDTLPALFAQEPSLVVPPPKSKA
ncbi:hypothetical protein [Asticcacaulis sp. EMRT-3]|uniref:hypothetical protein n=1 Tax=Asticcacaulis sp. EMRT-3 TaxID=3040349 RepID=UPI0024AF5570|nr:hypothetical protein [Asticcacaulis sp. EMRT-3]MDI7776538.1 hypothetical protein [Asticcacaulis sp. EMRT-3]